MASLNLTYQDIINEVAEFLSMGPNPVDRDLDKVKRAVYKGYRKFLYPIDPTTKLMHIWSFLRVWGSLQTISGQWKYALPKDFSRIVGDLVFGDNEIYESIKKVSSSEILKRRTVVTSDSYPVVFSVSSQPTNDEVGTLWEMWFDPAPSGSFQIRYEYLANPTKPEESTHYFKGNVDALECIQELCLGAAEQQELKTFGAHSQLGMQMLGDLVRSDGVPTADSLGLLRGTLSEDTQIPDSSFFVTLDRNNIYPE